VLQDRIVWRQQGREDAYEEHHRKDDEAKTSLPVLDQAL
jgi:hypothetical protein